MGKETARKMHPMDPITAEAAKGYGVENPSVEPISAEIMPQQKPPASTPVTQVGPRPPGTQIGPRKPGTQIGPRKKQKGLLVED